MTPQPLLIFRKDLTHLWPETLLTLLLFVGLTWASPSGWQQSEYAVYAGLLDAFLKLLLPIAWIVMISRLIHDEPLVGDRQFWTSRPYHWAKLLAAKLLYILTFIYLPFLLMQVYLLKHAGLHPTMVIPALLHNLLLLTVIIIIPVAAIAAVTATFARLFLSVLGGLIYVAILFGYAAYLVLRDMPAPQLKPIFITILILLPAAVLVYQYATRKTTNARIALVATPLLVVILLLLTPSSALIRSAYPAGHAPAEVKLSSLPDQYRPQTPQPGKLAVSRGEVPVGFPFLITGIDKDSNYSVDGASVTLDGNGNHYVSPYSSSLQQLNAGTSVAAVTVPLPEALLTKLEGGTDVHLTLAAEHFKAQAPSTWKATLLPFDVPGHGVCSYPADEPNANPVCRYAFAVPELNFVSATLTPGSCASPSGAPMPARARIGGPKLSLLDFDPVISVPLALNAAGPQGAAPGILCPGTPLQFVEAKSEGRTRLELTDKQVKLQNYAVHDDPAARQQRPTRNPGPMQPQ